MPLSSLKIEIVSHQKKILVMCVKMYYLAIQLELIPSSLMITEKGFSERSQVIVMVSSSGETERSITVLFTTSDDTATG